MVHFVRSKTFRKKVNWLKIALIASFYYTTMISVRINMMGETWEFGVTHNASDSESTCKTDKGRKTSRISSEHWL